MPIDPVCGKEITNTRDAAKTEYQGRLYYFESAECKRAFEDDPRRYTSGERK
ncbi:MAG: YHS domain-containing protein [Methanotrichaceae archaeon]